VQEQIFGPVVVAMPSSDPAELVPRANDNVSSLAAGI
jgi:acyl-CoA reductase-like NAD-dependent aldehyde dehydrogenase